MPAAPLPHAAVALALLSVLGASQARAQPVESAADAKAIIWAKEVKIYQERSGGSIQYYEQSTSPAYLGWPPFAPAPFRRDGLHRTAPRVADKGEKVQTDFVDFTLDGDTALIYYVNHRTAAAGGAPVDQRYANVHVWVKRDGDWKLLGGMAREAPAKTQP